MVATPQPDPRAELEAALARAAQELRDHPDATIQVPAQLTDEEIAELERQEEELNRQLAEFYAAHPDSPRVLASDYVIEDRGSE